MDLGNWALVLTAALHFIPALLWCRGIYYTISMLGTSACILVHCKPNYFTWVLDYTFAILWICVELVQAKDQEQVRWMLTHNMMIWTSYYISEQFARWEDYYYWHSISHVISAVRFALYAHVINNY